MPWGAQVRVAGCAAFALWAPAQAAPMVEIDGAAPLPLVPDGDGWFALTAAAAPGARYRYVLDDGARVPDPAARAQAGGVHGWSVVTDPAAYAWRTPGWRGRPWAEMVIEEVHVGLAGGFAALAAALPAIAADGVTAIELMPLGAFAGTRGWGYDGVLPFAPHEAYGSPDDLRALIDAAHALGLSVLVDVVYNHFGPDGNRLADYAPGFFDAAAHTPWGGAVAVETPAVAAFFIENALMWLVDYRCDGLRLDAVHAIRNPGFLDRLAGVVRARVGPGRHVHLVLENEDNDAGRLAPGVYDAQWNDDFHNVLHVMLTGERHAYYADFADRPAERLARCLGEGFVYQGEPMGARDAAPRGTPSGHLPPTAFVAFLQNHDQVGNRALGERLAVLADPARLRAAQALLLLAPHIPLLFMGEREGVDTPFLFFTDFHDELAETVRDGRRREFAGSPGFADAAARAAIPDPNDPATFAASHVIAGPGAASTRDRFRHLLALRRAHIVPRLAHARAAGARAIGPAAVLARWTLGDGAVLTIALNLGDAAVALPAGLGVPFHADGTPGAPASFAAWLGPA